MQQILTDSFRYPRLVTEQKDHAPLPECGNTLDRRALTSTQCVPLRTGIPLSTRKPKMNRSLFAVHQNGALVTCLACLKIRHFATSNPRDPRFRVHIRTASHREPEGPGGRKKRVQKVSRPRMVRVLPTHRPKNPEVMQNALSSQQLVQPYRP